MRRRSLYRKTANFGGCVGLVEAVSVLLLENPFTENVHYLQQVVGASSTLVPAASNIINPLPPPLCSCLYNATLYPVFVRPVLLNRLERCGLQRSLDQIDDNVPTRVIEGPYRDSVVVFPVPITLR